ncbi:histidine kinase [Jatrophihabitans sp.]|uniref:sensor histidine kinase n=1 Tax=Jatrophihabitans sp. TaxID=1932789 RepID=UPI0030C73E9C|nr:Histidine kinase [Jatrophihabitans sp.]
MGASWKRRVNLLWWAVQSVATSVISLVLFIYTAVALALVTVWVGIPMLGVTIRLTRMMARRRRRYVGGFLGSPLESGYLEPAPGSLLARILALVLDPATRRDALWLLVDGTVGLALSIIALVEAIFDLLLWWLPLAVAAKVHWRLDRPLLSVSEKSRLALRVQQLTSSRAETVDTSAAELRRIERDLHDGAQARLVALGMNLALAENQLDNDPEGARALLAEAREASGVALAELRGLVRGIHPPVLADRGLVGAVEALALTAPFPVAVTSDVPGRLPAPVESGAYFAVAEGLANVIKHAAATTTSIRLALADDVLHFEVVDDGVGGASVAPGGGLAGIAKRLAAFDGTLAVESPPGGGTRLVMVLPCVSSSPKTSPSSGTA